MLNNNVFLNVYLSNNNEKRKPAQLFILNIVGTSIALVFITILSSVVLDLDFGFLSTYLFFLIITTPIIVILNFCLAMFYLIFLIMFLPTVKISEFFVTIYIFNTIIFINNSICLTLYLMNENRLSYILVLILTLLSSFIGFLFLKSALNGYVGFTKKVSLIFSLILLILNITLFLGGTMIDVT